MPNPAATCVVAGEEGGMAERKTEESQSVDQRGERQTSITGAEKLVVLCRLNGSS